MPTRTWKQLLPIAFTVSTLASIAPIRVAEAQTLWPCPSPYWFNTSYTFEGNFGGQLLTKNFTYTYGSTGLGAVGIGTYYFQPIVSNDLMFTLLGPWIMASCSRWLFVGPFGLSSVIFIESLDHGGTMVANFEPPEECGAATSVATADGEPQFDDPFPPPEECDPEGGGGGGGEGGGDDQIVTVICMWKDWYDPVTLQFLYSTLEWCAAL